MKRPILLLISWAVLVCGVASADGDPVGAKLTAAKKEYEKAVAGARSGLLAELKKKQDAAQQAGDLKTLEKVMAEAKAFEERGQLPKSVPVKGYEGQLRVARVRMDEGYKAAVEQYTKDSQIALAKTIQQEWDEFKNDSPAAVNPADPFKVNSVWVAELSSGSKVILKVTERNGEKFRATFKEGKVERDITGVVKDGKVSWLAKDVRPVQGGAGDDNFGTFGRDKSGQKIDFTWQDPATGRIKGRYILRPGK